MIKIQKVGVIVWTIDPEGNKRFLLRHNKPFNGREDEWTIVFGGVEESESLEKAAIREVFEEYSINDSKETKNLDYKIKFTGKDNIEREIHFFSVKLENIDAKVALNEESIGYDWVKIDKVREMMKHEDEKKAFDIV